MSFLVFLMIYFKVCEMACSLLNTIPLIAPLKGPLTTTFRMTFWFSRFFACFLPPPKTYFKCVQHWDLVKKRVLIDSIVCRKTRHYPSRRSFHSGILIDKSKICSPKILTSLHFEESFWKNFLKFRLWLHFCTPLLRLTDFWPILIENGHDATQIDLMRRSGHRHLIARKFSWRLSR